jgi:hypothetical protein
MDHLKGFSEKPCRLFLYIYLSLANAALSIPAIIINLTKRRKRGIGDGGIRVEWVGEEVLVREDWK